MVMTQRTPQLQTSRGTRLAYAALCLVLLPALKASAQATPAGVDAPYRGFQLPTVGDTLRYSVTASETASSGYGSGEAFSTNISGNAGYLSKGEVHPFSFLYSGGYLSNVNGESRASTFQNLALSQVYKTPRWNFVVADSFSYLPESPLTGFSGIAGLGDLGVGSVQVGPVAEQGILAQTGQEVINTISGSASHSLTGKTSVQGTGSYSILRFLTNSQYGLDSNQLGASGGLQHRLDARNSLGANYSYSTFSYPGQSFSFTSQGVNLEYTRQWSRRLQMDISAGPERTKSSNDNTSPASLNLAVTAGLSYVRDDVSYALTYNRSAMGGFGVVQGVHADSLGFVATRRIGRLWNVSTSDSYSQATSLPGSLFPGFSSHTLVLGGQVSRAISRTLSAYGSYTLEKQSLQGTVIAQNAYSGFFNIVGFGITWAPSAIHLNRR